MRRFVRPALIVLFTSIATVFAFALQSPTDPPKPLTGKVVGIADGDTITVLLDRTQHKIRLEGIDAPEGHQDFGTKAKQVLGDKVFGKEVKIVWTARDKYKRILGEVYLGDRHINLEMVKEGYAWHYVQYSKDRELAKAQAEAKEKKLGLWSMPNPIPPWEFRKGKTDDKADTDAVYVTSSGKKYHRAGCKYLAKSKIAIPLKDAAARFEPCSHCKPPLLPKADDAKKTEK